MIYVEQAFTLTQFEKEFQEPGNTFWLMEKRDKLVGYVKLRKNVLPESIHEGRGLEIKRFYLHGDFHGKGFAQILMDHTLKIAHKENCNIVWLGVWPQNTKAIKFYKKFDFIFDGEIKFVLGNKVEWDWVMKKTLI